MAFEAYAGGLRMPTFNGLLVTAWIARLPLVPGADLLPARRRPDRPGARRGVRQSGAGVRRGLAVTLINEPFAAFHAVALALVIGGIWLAQRTGKSG